MNIPVRIEDFPNHNESIGRIGENLVSYYLEAVGIECSIVDRRGSDIWCKSSDGKLFTIEVKSTPKTHLAKTGLDGTEYRYYTYTLKKKEADQFVLVCLDTSLIRILSKEMLLKRVNKRMLHMKPEEFTEELMRQDIERLKDTYSLTQVET